MMKRYPLLFLLLLILPLFSGSVQAQVLPMFRLGAGYSGNFSTNNITVYGSTHKLTGFGRGVNAQLGLGVRVADFVGLELGLGYLAGIRYSISYQEPGVYYTNQTVNLTQRHSSSIFQLIPAIVLSPFESTVAPYGRFGILVGFGSVTEENIESFQGNSFTEKIKSTGGAAFGLQAAAGLRVEVAEGVGIYGEVFSTNASYGPTKFTRSATGQSSVSGTYRDNSDPNNPSQRTTQRVPMNNVGFMVGISVNL